MKLVLIYTDSDEYTYCNDVVLPIEYESPEQALVDFEAAARHCREEGTPKFEFAGFEFWPFHFFPHKNQINLPEILTIEQWFNSCGKLMVNSHGAGAHG